MAKTEETFKYRGSLRTIKKLSSDKNKMYALRDEQGIITHNIEEVINVAVLFYTQVSVVLIRLDTRRERMKLLKIKKPSMQLGQGRKSLKEPLRTNLHLIVQYEDSVDILNDNLTRR